MAAEVQTIEKFATPAWSVLLVILVIVSSLAVLVAGWIADLEIAARILPGGPAMVPSTAILFAVVSACLLYYRVRPEQVAIVFTAAIFTIIVALLNIALIGLSLANGIDAAMWPAFGDFNEDRMALATALCFILLSIALLTLPDNSNQTIFAAAATSGWIFSLVALVGYMFDAEALYGIPLFTAMALPTAFLFVVLFTVVLFARPDRGWMRMLMGPGPGSAAARRLMPLVVGVPLALCYLALLGTRANLYDADFRLSLLAILIVVLLTVSVLRNAVIENKIQEEYELLMQEVYHRIKNNLQQINGLIMLEARALPRHQRSVLYSLSTRVGTLVNVHELLLTNQSPSTLNLSSFLKKLCGCITQISGAENRNIEIRVESEDLPIQIDLAVSIGLLVNELVTNALKHAFEDGDQGTVLVSLKTAHDKSLRLIVQDNGRGIEEQPDPTGNRGAGCRIIRGLIRQLQGSMEVTADGGTCVEVTLPAQTLNRSQSLNAVSLAETAA